MSARNLTIELEPEFWDKMRFITKRDHRSLDEQVAYFLEQAINLYFSDPLIEEEYICSRNQDPDIPF